METHLFTREENISFGKDLALILIFFIVTPLTLAVSLFSLFSLKSNALARQKLNTPNLLVSPQSGVKVYASLPVELPSVSSKIESADARGEIIKQYLESYRSPLTPYADQIVEVADRYSLDYRLTTAIAQQESGLCKIIPPQSYNCWGWGIHSKGTLGFDSFDQGIEEVSRGLREEYLDKGYVTIEDIMSKYTPLSNGSWAKGVNTFMTDMQ
jgi:hypothetical protein